MRKLSLLFTLGLILVGFTGLQAADVNVTFQVDMNVQILKGNFDPVTQVVRLAGSMQGWSPTLAPDMEDPDGDGIYAVTYTMSSGDHQYKYVIGTDWGNNEGDPNRSITIGTNDTTIAPVYYNGETAVTFPASSDTTVILHLAVNMTRQMQIANFDPATDVVRAAGSFQGWSPADAPDMSDPDGNGTYVVTYEVKPNTTYAYKFVIGTDWGNNESDPNREFTVGANDTAAAPVYFDNDPYVVPVVGDSIMVTLQVDMSVKILEGFFDPSTDVVRAAGSYQGWNPGAAPDMDDSDGDSVYVGTYKMPANSEQQYKFIIGTDWGNNEDNNRVINLGAADTVIAPVFYNNDDVVTEIKDGSINFNVRMDVMAEVLIFDPTKDSLQVRGGFNGWNGDDVARSHMSAKTTDPLEWFLNVPFVQQGVGDNQAYKFYVAKADQNTMWTDGWERPASQGGGNRDVAFAGVENQDANEGITYYDDVQPDWVIEGSTGETSVAVVFSVDMTPAMDADLQAVPFDPATDTLYWIGEMPSFVNTQGWEDTDQMRVLKLTDDDGDNIFTATLSLVTPTFNTFEYRYAWRSQDGSWTFEPAGFGDFAYRIRYIGQDAARSFPTIPWDMPVDTWTNQEDKSDQQELDPYKSLTAIGDTPEVPAVYELAQNYPNPFNPSTTIKFTVPVAGKVTLTVYNVVGQKIATLINGNVTAGSHTRVWNGLDDAGNQVASGVYFYKLSAEKFTATEKMILMK